MNKKEYILKDGIFKFPIKAPEKCCLFCKHCTDVFWDYTNGPYMFMCDLCQDSEDGYYARCKDFEEDEKED